MSAYSYETLKARDHVAELRQLVGEIGVVGTTRDDMLSGPNGIYMAHLLPLEALDITFKSIGDPLESMGLEASDSHHEVRFVKVDFENSEGEEREVMVAVKHYDNELESAGVECDALLEMQNRGFDALAPVAIVKNDDDAYLFTLLRPDIRSMDNHNWAIGPDEKGFETVTENLHFIAESLARLHAAGIFHGDAQPKNFARSDTGEYVAIDLEKGCEVTMDVHHQVAAYNGLDETEASNAYGDLKLLWMTLNRSIGLNQKNIFLGEGASKEQIYQVFNQDFVQPYLDTLASKTDPDVYMQFDVDEVVGLLDEFIRNDLRLPAEQAA